MEVIVDGQYPALMEIGTFGTFSERLSFTFKQTHPIHGERFMTKYFFVKDANTWAYGYEGETIQWKSISTSRTEEPDHANPDTVV